MKVYLDSAVENMVPELALEATQLLSGTWNGWARPVATAEAWGDFLERWRVHDPNGEWGHATEIGGRLISSRDDPDEPDLFPQVNETVDGQPLYDLSGLVWTLLS